jgi:hypothetical protein
MSALISRQYAVCKCGDFAYAHQGLTGKCSRTNTGTLIAGKQMTCKCPQFEEKDSGG